MAYENNKNFDEKRNVESIFSKRIKAGKRRTYFFDVRETRGSDYFITITESKKRFNDEGYDRHKMFIYKEDFNKFLTALTETVDHVKTELMPDFDFDAFNHDESQEYAGMGSEAATPVAEKSFSAADEPQRSAETEFNQQANELPAETEVATEVTNEDILAATLNKDDSVDSWKL